MNDRRPSPLPRDVEDVLAAERARPGVDPVTRARARARLSASLLAGGSGGSDGGEPQPGPPRAIEAASSPRRLWAAARHAHPLLTAAVGFAVGMSAGVALHARLAAKAPEPRRQPPASAVPATSRAPEATRALPEPTLSSPGGVAEDPTVPAAAFARPFASASPGAAPPVPSASTLTAERALLDVAHAALGKGQAADALVALTQHTQRFPRGVYREEREALTVQCLRALGRTDEARARAAAFAARYPKSLFLSLVERSEQNP